MESSEHLAKQHDAPAVAQMTGLENPQNLPAAMSSMLKVTKKQTSSRAPPPSTPSPSDPLELLAKAKASTLKALGDIGTAVSEELLTELSKLNPGEKKKRVHELTRLSRYELEIENNKARNRALASQLGISDAAHLFAATQAKQPDQPTSPGDEDDYIPSRKSTDVEENTQARRSLRNKAAILAEPRPSTTLITEPAGRSPTSSCSNGSSTVLANTRPNDPPSTTSPKWFINGWKTFSTVSEETYGTVWLDAVKAWRTLEEATGFEPQVCLSVSVRGGRCI